MDSIELFCTAVCPKKYTCTIEYPCLHEKCTVIFGRNVNKQWFRGNPINYQVLYEMLKRILRIYQTAEYENNGISHKICYS